MSSHNDLGHFGEQVAANYLTNKGYQIVASNYVYDRAEIDIIATLNGLLVFIEVKTRSNTSGGFPELAVSDKKINLLAKAAKFYIEENNYVNEIRFDIISIIGHKKKYVIKHFEDAFFPNE